MPSLETDRNPEEEDPGLPKKNGVENLRHTQKLRVLASTADAVQRATILKWKWGGHLARVDSYRWPQLFFSIILLFLDHCSASLGEYFTMVFTTP